VSGLAVLERRIATLAARLAPPRAVLSPGDVARLAGLELDPWQREAAESGAAQIILLASRQSGKSTVTAVMAAHTAAARPRSLTLILSPSQRQSQELFRTVKATHAALGAAAPAATQDAALSLVLANGSRIVALPGKEQTIRGFSGVDLLIEDEAARVPDPLYEAIRPMLAVSGGRIVLLSTPWGKRGHFHRVWTEGVGWHRLEVAAPDCPRISAAWLAAERAAVPDFVFRQEYLVEFVEAEGSYFAYDDIRAALDSAVTPLFGGDHRATA